VQGGKVSSARAWVLAAPDVHAHNDFANPDAVKPQSRDVQVSADGVRITIPAASVVKIQAQLA
jgi:alpha-N-arabinofuranosidase